MKSLWDMVRKWSNGSLAGYELAVLLIGGSVVVIGLVALGLTSLTSSRDVSVRDTAYWVERIRNNSEESPLTQEEIDQIPDEAWAEVMPQIIRIVPKPAEDGSVGLSSEPFQEIVCHGKECDKYLEAEAEQPVGFIPVTGYKSTLTVPMTTVVTSLTVASITTKDNHTLQMVDFGNEVYLSIEPGGTKEEIVRCTGLTSASRQFTSCARGLAFYGRDVTSVSANQFQHFAGSIVQMSNVHYVYGELVDKDAQSVYDQFVGGTHVYTSSSPFMFGSDAAGLNCFGSFRNGSTSTTLPRLCYDNSNSYWVFSDNGTDTYRAASSTDITAGQGLQVTASQVSVATSTFSGLKFVNEGGVFKLTGATSTNSGGSALGIDSTGGWLLRFDNTSGLTLDSQGRLAVSPNFTNLTVSNNLYLGGALTATSTSATSSFANVTLGDLTGNVIIPDWAASSTNTSATGTFTGNLQINGSLSATGINYIGPQVAIGTFTKGLTTGGNTTSTHNLGVVPRTVEVYCSGPSDSTGAVFFSNGFATGVSSEQSVASAEDGTNGQAVTDSSNLVRAINDVTYSAGSGVGGNLTILNSSIMEITWTITNSISETMQCMYKVSR